MNRDYLKNKWLTIENDRREGEFKILRYFSDPETRLFLAIDEKENRAIIIYSDNINSIDRLPVEKENVNLLIKDDAVILLLTNPGYQDVFDDLVLSISSTIKKEEQIEKHLSLFIYKYTEWATFFRNGSSKLSFEQLMGLYGELIILRDNLLSENQFTHYKILSSWKGPSGAVHDFVFDEYDLEVKTKLYRTATVNISSKYQLEPVEDRQLILSVVNLLLDDSEGKALSSLIISIREILSASNSDISPLYKALSYFDITMETSFEYDNFRFILHSVDMYNTTMMDFPKLVINNLISGISSVKYKIETKSIQSFKITKTD